jgi:short-subunit dehydrogenase
VTKLEAGAVVVITGAGSGIGRATALAFARRGCRLVLGDVDFDAVAGTASAGRARFGADAAPLRCDVRYDEDVSRLVDEARSQFGRVDVMVNNAGVGHYGRVEDTEPARLTELFDVNVLGVQRGIRAVVPVMRSQRSGSIVIVGSMNGKVSWPYHGPYSATKFALTGLAQALRMELAGSGVRCSLVLPVNVQTRFFDSARVDSAGYRPEPIGKMRSPASVARTIVRAAERGSGELHTAASMRVASAIAGVAPALPDRLGGWWYRRHRPAG